MHLQVLASGSKGNSTLVRAGELNVLFDAGLTARAMTERLELARLGLNRIEHVVVSHGHLDHARSSGILARRFRATLHAAQAIHSHPAIRRSERLADISPARAAELRDAQATSQLEVHFVRLPHDCDPTYAFRLEHEGRRAVILTDMGRPDANTARELRAAHVIVLEANYCPELLENGPYPPALKRRIAGGRGHLSNAQACDMLRELAGPELHTVVLAHLSETNNSPERALETVRTRLDELGLESVRLLAAQQASAIENLKV